MKVAVLGATGPSGLQVVQEALERGHDVTAIVRNPEKLTDSVKDDKLKVVKADIFDPDSMVEGLTGQEAVLSCLGCRPSFLSISKITFYTDTAKTIVAAMRKASVTRLIFMSSWHSVYNPNDSFMINWVLKPLFLGQSLHNMGEMEAYLKTECPDIEYTSVRPPQLVNGASSGKPVKTHEGQEVPDAGRMICRRDVAKFMLDTAESGNWKKTCVAITT